MSPTNWPHRTAPTTASRCPATDDLGTLLGGLNSIGNAINDSGQVVGASGMGSGGSHAFRTAPNKKIDPATDDLGTLGGLNSSASGINNSGQVVAVGCDINLAVAIRNTSTRQKYAPNGTLRRLAAASTTVATDHSFLADNATRRAYRTAPGQPIRAGDDLGTLGGSSSEAAAIITSGKLWGVPPSAAIRSVTLSYLVAADRYKT